MDKAKLFGNEVKIVKITPAFTDDRGSISDVLDEGRIKHIGMLTFSPGAVRGRHYHKKSDQYNFLISGQLELKTRSPRKNSVTETLILNPGDLAYVPRRVIHALRGLKNSVMMDFNTQSRGDGSYEQDNYRVEDF